MEKTIQDLQQRLASLEQRLVKQEEQSVQQMQNTARLELWQQGRVFSYIAKLYPKNRSVIFLHPDFFGDNIKYAYLGFRRIAEKYNVTYHFLTNSDEQRALLKQHGLPALPPLNEWKLDHLRLLMGTKVLVVSDHFTPYSWSPPLPYFLLQGARLIQLWHGIPFKEIGFLYGDTPQAGFDALRLSSTGPADVLVAPGTIIRDRWREWFAFRDFAPTGYPRTDVLMRDAVGEELINVDVSALNALKSAREKSHKTIIYAPTFRDHAGAGWLEKTDLAALASWCDIKGYLLYVKLHPVEMQGLDALKQKLPAVKFAAPNSDPYPLLRHADLLITDYSSIALDFLLLDRPMIFYCPDHADYVKQCRNLLPGYEHYIAGDHVTDGNALRSSIENAFMDVPGPWAKKRQMLTRELYDQRDDGAADRVALLILEQLDRPEELPAGWGI